MVDRRPACGRGAPVAWSVGDGSSDDEQLPPLAGPPGPAAVEVVAPLAVAGPGSNKRACEGAQQRLASHELELVGGWLLCMRQGCGKRVGERERSRLAYCQGVGAPEAPGAATAAVAAAAAGL